MRAGPFVVQLLALLAAALGFVASPALAQHVAAAANLQSVLPEVVAAYVRQGGQAPRLAYGSSGNFVRQIRQGAPFELFLSADSAHVDAVIAAGLGEGAPRVFALGRLALFLPAGSPVAADRDLADLGRALRDGRLKRLAIANPEHAPFGRAAKEVLERQGHWTTAADRLVLGDNAAQAAQFMLTGAAQAGLLPLSLAKAPEVAARGAYATLPANWHGPLPQTALLVRGSGEPARRFAAFLHGPEAREIFRRHGFDLP